MMDLRSLLIVATAMILTLVVTGMALLSAGSVEGVAAARVLRAHSHDVILLQLRVSGVTEVTRVDVNGLTVWEGRLLVTPGASTLLVESVGSVRVFGSPAEAYAYVKSEASGIFPGRPLPEAPVYHVTIYTADGSKMTVTVYR